MKNPLDQSGQHWLRVPLPPPPGSIYEEIVDLYRSYLVATAATLPRYSVSGLAAAVGDVTREALTRHILLLGLDADLRRAVNCDDSATV